jgi:hypothetical protein
MGTNLEYILKESILNELEKESFENDVHNICFLTQRDIDTAVELGIQKVFDQINNKIKVKCDK